VRASISGLPTTPGAHVLLITIDALRADHLGSYGYARPVSPELDALAKRAVVFERAYAQAPHSSYSLSSLHTSAYVHEIVELGRPLPTATLATALRDHGYHTAAFFTDGIFHTEGQKLIPLRDGAFGFALFDHTNRESEQQTDRVLAEVDRIKQRGEPPSLLWVHYFDVHEPYQETTFGGSELDRYDSEILHVDREVARLIKELKARLSRELVITITADHGEEFRDHGGVYHGSTLFDEQVRVPLILQVPGLDASRFAAPVESIDIVPTLLGAVGAPVPTSMRGRDLRALALGKASAGPVFSAVLTKRMALSWPYKLIADLRFGLYELYDLKLDPQERRNLAGQQPERLRSQRELVYAWLDSIGDTSAATSAQGSTGEQAWRRALELGRLGDRRAAAPTSELLLNPAAPTALRVEAGQILAKLADPSSVPALLAGLSTTPKLVAAEAAIALGRLYDESARPALRELMHVEDPYLRARAAVSLGRLRDTHAVPALIDALWVAPTQYEREEAVRWLGRLRDPRAIEPLLSLLSEFSLRYLLAVALGQIGGQSGDTRAYQALVGMLDWESRTNIRDEVVRGLGLLGDKRAVPILLATLEQEPALKNTAESLIRLGALTTGELGGVDLNKKTKASTGLAHCEEGPLFHDWDYLERTRCTSTGPRVQLSLPVPRALTSARPELLLIVRAKRADGGEPVECTTQLADQRLDALRVDGEYREQRFEVALERIRGAAVSLVFSCPGASLVTLDHALLLSRSAP
jgi:arylsulfatase A-like enzyme